MVYWLGNWSSYLLFVGSYAKKDLEVPFTGHKKKHKVVSYNGKKVMD